MTYLLRRVKHYASGIQVLDLFSDPVKERQNRETGAVDVVPDRGRIGPEAVLVSELRRHSVIYLRSRSPISIRLE